ncbi:hypothetical protein SAMN05216255_1162 [Pseudomonas segetis]|uniref:Uncharacterized protein n=1 Tax=Pseudomonas segetis TaxID=298908 RepID=A0A239AHM1_9PSED|nr:hypothetical protein SAMN05216255_1162 [Pseudomonas segetis]
MPVTSHHTRLAGLTTNILAITLLALPIPTHAALKQPIASTISLATQHPAATVILSSDKQ